MTVNSSHPPLSNPPLSPERIREKADTLETRLFKTITTQTDPSKMQIKLDRKLFPDMVIFKALTQLMPRFNIKPGDFLLDLRNLLQKPLKAGAEEKLEKTLSMDTQVLYHDTHAATRTFKAIVTRDTLDITVQGIAPVPSCDGEIAKSFFNHEKSPGKLLKDGVINFKEINNYPIVTEGDDLFYITYEKQGSYGLSYTGELLPVQTATPYSINIGPGVQKVEDYQGSGTPKGYYLKAIKTGVVSLERDLQNQITAITISDEIEVVRLDYSTGNIGTTFTCPVRMKVGVICNGFKIRAHGRIEATIVDGGDIITNNEAIIMKAQSGSSVMALKDITIDAATRSKLISETGVLTIKQELIDSKISAPQVIFEKSKGFITHNQIETENLTLTGLYFSGETVIHFGNNLFVEKKARLTAIETVDAEMLELKNTEKRLMTQLQTELKRLTQLAPSDPELVKFIKPLIIATQTMDFSVIHKEMDAIQKRNNTKVVAQVKKTFDALEKLPGSLEALLVRKKDLEADLASIDARISAMKLKIDGLLRRAATLKIFCGAIEDNKTMTPDFMVECDGEHDKTISITGTYTPHKGFEFNQSPVTGAQS